MVDVQLIITKYFESKNIQMTLKINSSETSSSEVCNEAERSVENVYGWVQDRTQTFDGG